MAICAQTMGFTSCAEGLSLSTRHSHCLGQLLTGTHTCVAKVATVKHQGLGVTLVLLTAKHMMCPQKAPEQEQVNTKAGGERQFLLLYLKKRKQQAVWVSRFDLKSGW